MEDHISRILKMLEEGKISATEAQTLIAALKEEAKPAQASAASNHAHAEAAPDSASKKEEAGKARSFEFDWSQKRAFPFDFGGLGKQISEAVKKIDPERIVREAREGFTRGGRRFNEAFKGWGIFTAGSDGRPENTLGYPVARDSASLSFEIAEDATLQVDNPYGAIAVFGGAPSVSVEIEKEAWAPTEEEAKARLEEIKVESNLLTPEIGPARLEIKVIAPENWRDGILNLRLKVPDSLSLRLAAAFGEIRVEDVAGAVEASSASGAISLDRLRGEVRAETASGDARAADIGGHLHLSSKSGDVKAENLSAGGTVQSVSGDVSVSRIEGARLEAKTVSGDVRVEAAGEASPMEITLESVSGDVDLLNARGGIVLKTVSGDVEAAGLDARTIQAQTVSGDVKLAFSKAFNGTLSSSTVSGDVTLRAPHSSSFRFTLGAQSGDFTVEFHAEDSHRTDTLWTGRVGAGDGTIDIQTRTGDIRLEKSD